MNDYTYSPFVLARVPLLDYKTAESVDAILLNRKDFRTALFFASRSFYNELSKKQFIYSLLSDKERQTVKKYLNRAAFRSTPFGLFAFVSVLGWDTRDEVFKFDEAQVDIKLDFAALHELSEQGLGRPVADGQRLHSNASLYFNNVDFRYIKKWIEGSSAKFSVVSIEKNAILKSLLSFCRRQRTVEQILHFLAKRNISANEGKNFILALIEEQILVSDDSPNITGPDYLFVRANCEAGNSVIRTIEKQLEKKIAASSVLEYAVSLANQMDRYFKKPDSTNYFYCVSQCEVSRGSMNIRYQKSLEEGLYCLGQLSRSFVRKDLQSFVKAFVRKYETREVPLLEALDAQFGVGYGGLDQIKVNYGFSSTGYNDREQGEATSGSSQNSLAEALIREWQLHFKCGYELEITNRQLQQLKSAERFQNQPPSISILFRTLGDKVFIESAGGISALALIGRFGFIENVYQYAKTIAHEEQSQNKNVIFAEIAHLCDLHTANINRRPHFYDYEIPVLTYSVLPYEKQIPLSDLLVSVRGDKVFLRSKKLKKIVVPRLSSAFNYTRNQLPVFRFLCDLQGQDIEANLNFSLSAILPGLPFYPRVIYKSCILQLAEWHLEGAGLNTVKRSDDVFTAFHELAKSINLPRFFSYSIGDNFLVFDTEKKDDIQLFLSEAENKNFITLKEFPFLNGEEMCSNKEGNALTQYIASLVLKKEVYSDPQLLWEQNKEKLITNDWVYFKLYCHPLSSDIILVHYLFPLIEKLKKEGLLISWFWVRYKDPDYHIRLRAKVNSKSKAKVVQQITICMDKACSEKLASHFQTDKYNRELERYSSALIEQVEAFFHESSELVASWLRQQKESNYEDTGVILSAVLSSLVILNAFEIRDQAGLCKNAFESFFVEFHSSKNLKTEMEKLYRQVNKKTDLLVCSSQTVPGFEALIISVKHIVSMYRWQQVKETSLEKLAVDMIHMHLNRLFIYNQRYFEMIHYYLLYRTLYKHLYKAIR